MRSLASEGSSEFTRIIVNAFLLHFAVFHDDPIRNVQGQRCARWRLEIHFIDGANLIPILELFEHSHPRHQWEEAFIELHECLNTCCLINWPDKAEIIRQERGVLRLHERVDYVECLSHCSFLYSKLDTSPLDKGPEQGYTCSLNLLNAPGKGSVLHPVRPIEKDRLLWQCS